MTHPVLARIAAIVSLGLVMGLSAPTPSSARSATDSPSASCGRATLVTSSATARNPHGDGKFTPILLVHGWNGHPDMWSGPIDRSALPHQPSGNRTLAANLQRLRGAAVYTLDYHAVAERWFTQKGAGGQIFLDAVRCLMANKAFQGHKMIVVAHSMGGLITRWAVNTDPQLRARVSTAITLSTPYEGSWLATAATLLADGSSIAARTNPNLARLMDLVHLLTLGCAGHDNTPGCAELNKLLRTYAAMRSFAFGSGDLDGLKPWPQGIAVETLGTRIVIENFLAELFASAPVPGDLDIGDGVVDVNSAGGGKQPGRVPECRYTASRTRATVDGLLGAVGWKADTDKRRYMPLVAAIFGNYTTCGHGSETHLIELTNEVLGAVDDQLKREEPKPSDPTAIRFDGIGELNLRLTATDLRQRGYVNEGNQYEGSDAACVRYAKNGRPLSASVDSRTGRILAIRNFGGDQSLHTQLGNIRVGSTLAQLRTAFRGYQIEEHFDLDFGQGSNGVVINGPGGSIAIGLTDTTKSDYTTGRATISYLSGVGLPGHAPTLAETGC